MDIKLKVYSISVMAFLSINDALEMSFITEADNSGEVHYVEHLPAILPARSIQQAADAAKIFALDHWKTSDGWFGHEATIMPVTKDFYEKAFEAYEAGEIDIFDESEQGSRFVF